MKSSKTESTAFYSLLITVILAPLAFIPSAYLPLEMAKTVIISLGILFSAVLYGFIAYKEKSIFLPPKGIFWTSVAIVISLILSSIVSPNFTKAFFGQGFELGAAGFLILLFLGGLVAYNVIRRDSKRAVTIYFGLAGAFVLLFLFHALRLIFGAQFMTLSILNGVTSTLVGGWFNLGIYAVLVVLIALSAISFLPLARKAKIITWIVMIMAALTAFIVSYSHIWIASFLAFILLVAAIYNVRPRREDVSRFSAFFRRLAWLPLCAVIVAAIMAWQGGAIAGPVVSGINAGYSELSLPWQMALDVTAGAIKSRPLLGVGPNHFVDAYYAFKPAGINQTDAWSIEFKYGFGLIPTFIATEGVLGSVAWLLFFIMLGIYGTRAIRKAPSDPHDRFILFSSYAAAVFVWLVSLAYVPSHAVMLFGFVMTGIFFAAYASFISQESRAPIFSSDTRMNKLMPSLSIVLIIIAVLWGIIVLKKSIAFAYFGSGLSSLSVGSADAADQSFATANRIDQEDLYWRSRAEVSLTKANQLAASVTATSTKDQTQSVATSVAAVINQAFSYAQSAAAFDPNDYYNYISEARAAETAANINMSKGYENAIAAYQNAIRLNPYNPLLYLSVARAAASQNKLPDALTALGAALQVKNNYLDAIFLLSQVQAAQGDLPNAIIAARVATQISPNSPQLFFQLGLLQYNAKDYAGAASSFESSVKLQSDYANAKYFLGLSYVRLNKISDAITQFEDLTKANPDSQEIAFILTNLRAGKSPFADAKPPVTASPEKRANLPIKETKPSTAAKVSATTVKK